MKYRTFETPTGPFFLIIVSAGSLRTSWLTESLESELACAGATESPRLEPNLAKRLRDYFAGEPADFSDIPTPRGSAFYQRCWGACRKIKRGRTISYGELAQRASGSSSGARAAGQAMRNNPLPIIVPCHRVVASTGHLGGFGGSDDPASPTVRTKRFLLNMEIGAARSTSHSQPEFLANWS